MSQAWLLEMVWRDVCFVHWRADAARIQAMLPPNVRLDRYDGEAWLSVVPFCMTGIHLRLAPTLPGFNLVPEINLRTYVRVGDIRGIWFFSLDATSPLLVRSARITTGLPYYNARIATSEDAHGITYRSERTERTRGAGTFEAHYAPPSIERPVEPESLAAFLHERYRFFSVRGGRLVCGTVRHRPWSLGTLAIGIRDNSLGELIGHPLAAAPDAAYFAREQHVRAAAVTRVPG